MRKQIILTGSVALLAIIGAVRVAVSVAQGACTIMVHALTHWGGWAPAEAAQAAPTIVFVLAAGLAMSLYGLHKDNQRYSRQSYGKALSGTALLRIAKAMLCGESASRRQRYSSELQSVDSTESFYKRSVST